MKVTALDRSSPASIALNGAAAQAVHPSVLVKLVFAVYAVMVVRTAWVCDDAFITLRTVDNFVSGYGLRWNVLERVQAYTHPLWMLLLSAAYFLTREPYFTTLALSIVCSLAAVYVALEHRASAVVPALGGALALVLSKAFVDYSTSGLENPLTHLLLALFFLVYWRGERGDRSLMLLSGLAGLLTLNRFDTLLLVGPPLAYAAAHSRRALPALAGFTPVVLWEAFAIVYYGFPFPNSAYAKLGGEVPARDRIEQGFYYLSDSINLDPITLLLIGIAVAAAFALRRSADRPVAVGILLTLVYIVRIGGDFMAGRMLAAPYFCAVMMLMRCDWSLPRGLLPLPLCAIIVVGLGSPRSHLLTSKHFKYDYEDRDGVVDERRVYFPYTALVNASQGNGPAAHPWARAAREVLARGDRVVVWGADGFYGFTAHQSLDIVDKFGIADPLLARLPAAPVWRPGHLERRVPEGYIETRQSGGNVIREPTLASYYDHLRLVTQDPLWRWERFRAIWHFNTGGYDDLIRRSSYGTRRLRAADLSTVRREAASTEDPEITRMHETGVEIDFGLHIKSGRLEISVDGNDDYVLVFADGKREIGRRLLWRAWDGGADQLHVTVLDVPASRNGFDRIFVRARWAWGTCSVGHIRIVP
jgi:arabinofuranosyltransferase